MPDYVVNRISRQTSRGIVTAADPYEAMKLVMAHDLGVMWNHPADYEITSVEVEHALDNGDSLVVRP